MCEQNGPRLRSRTTAGNWFWAIETTVQVVRIESGASICDQTDLWQRFASRRSNGIRSWTEKERRTDGSGWNDLMDVCVGCRRKQRDADRLNGVADKNDGSGECTTGCWRNQVVRGLPTEATEAWTELQTKNRQTWWMTVQQIERSRWIYDRRWQKLGSLVKFEWKTSKRKSANENRSGLRMKTGEGESGSRRRIWRVGCLTWSAVDRVGGGRTTWNLTLVLELWYHVKLEYFIK